MKAQTVLGIAACAAVCAASSAFADTEEWFNGNVGATTAKALSEPTKAEWKITNPTEVRTSDGKIELFNGSGNPLTLTPADGTAAKSDGLVTVKGSAALAPTTADERAAIPGTAKVALTVDEDKSFYGYVNGTWTKLTDLGEATLNEEGDAVVSFEIKIDYRTNRAKFTVGDKSQENVEIAAADKLASVKAYGVGVLSALSADYEVAKAAVVDGENETRYGSIEEAIVAAANGDGEVQPDKIAYVDDDGVTGNTDVVSGNGLKKWENEALGIDGDASIPLVPAETKKDGKITLALAETSTPLAGVNVTFAVSKDGGEPKGPYPSTAIEIEKDAGEHIYQVVPTITVK